MNEYKHFFLYEGHDILQTTIFDRKNIVKTSSNDLFFHWNNTAFQRNTFEEV